jgi:hypothetical protein
VDGQLRLREAKNKDPKLFYNHKLHNLQATQKYHEEQYRNKIAYIDECIVILKKKNKNSTKSQTKIRNLQTHKKTAAIKLKKQKNKIAIKLQQLRGYSHKLSV